MLSQVGIELRNSDFNALHATVWTNSLFAVSLRPFDPYLFHKILQVQESIIKVRDPEFNSHLG